MEWTKESDLILLICEGNAEIAIMNILLEHKMLVFDDEMLVDRKPIKTRKARDVEQKYLQLDYGKKEVSIVRILDSRNENFNLGTLYDNKVYNIYTRPEIEILYIISTDKYDEYTNKYKSKLKASEYCKEILQCKNVKSKDFINKHFSDVELLKETLTKYKSYSDKNELCIYDLLK